ncbi:hypothetical protein VHA01S_028_00080 [Vibrio halioticoli NBRC 102217]|uniref:NAD(P)-binding domain-containing protein n=1 Tax=Vibrio halioticoli NBRC 102217 TaxID=1219072 RepID=V5F3P9_9VIBR|nr:hypothetical protein [Vibrio halioticoli]GAD89809.1 hypothetical protein VHA01S_028_00080 [Vibrio halioticoli NBRC 102217]
MTITKPNIILAGGTGLIGQAVIDYLAQHLELIDTLYLPTRSPIHAQDSRFIALSNEAFFTLEEPIAELGIICLGTTKKQAGSAQALYRIDHDLVLKFAKQMQALGVRKLAVVSSFGANPNSLSHYLKCKGEMERDVSQLGFEQLIFARPGPLVGARSTPRRDEIMVQKLLKVVSPIMLGPLKNLRPVQADDVAKYLIQSLCQESHTSNTTIAHYRQLTNF